MKDSLVPIYDDKNIVEFAEQQLKVFWPVSYTHLTLPTNREV